MVSMHYTTMHRSIWSWQSCCHTEIAFLWTNALQSACYVGDLDNQLARVEDARSEASGLSTAAKSRAEELQDLIDLIPEDVNLQDEAEITRMKRKCNVHIYFLSISLFKLIRFYLKFLYWFRQWHAMCICSTKLAWFKDS